VNRPNFVGASTDHRAMLQMDNEPTPARMLVTFGSSKASCCPSIGSLTVDASVANSSEAASSTVVVEATNVSSASSAATMRVQNLAMSKVFNSSPTAANPAARDKSTTSALASGGGDCAPPRKRVPSLDMGQQQPPPPMRKGEDVAIPAPAPARRVRSTDAAKPSEADIFCQMKGLSFRDAPPDVNAGWFATLKKTKGATAGHAKKPNSSFSADTSGEFVISPRKQPEKQVFPVTPTFKTTPKSKNGMVASEAQVRADTRANKAATAKSKQGVTNLAIQGSRSSSNFNEKLFTKISRKVEHVPSSTSPNKKCEIVLSGNTTKSSKDRSFLPAPLPQTSGAGVEFVLWDMDDERDNCSATATMTTNASTLHNDQSPSTAATRDTLPHDDLLLLSRPLCHVESGLYERFVPERSRGSLYHNESFGESNRDSDFDDSRFDDDADGLALSEQENEMLMLALERSLHDMSHHQRSMEYQ
jgi:hypothetical protein